MDSVSTRTSGSSFGHVRIMALLSLRLKMLVFIVWIGMSIRGASAQTYTVHRATHHYDINSVNCGTACKQLSDGDVVECVPIEDQPSLQGLSNAFYTAPTSIPATSARFPNTGAFTALIANQTFLLEVGECPTGSIPILQSVAGTTATGTQSNSNVKKSRLQPSTLDSTSDDVHHEFAYAYAPRNGQYFGAQMIMNLWTPYVESTAEYSIGQVWLQSGTGDYINTAEAGFEVDPSFGNYSRLFVYWTADDYGKTGCFNLACSGFIQVSNKVLLRGAFKYTSSDGDELYEIKITLFKDESTYDTWFMFNDEVVGYWPNSIYPETGLRNYGDIIYWGGDILADDTEDGTTHTKTDMGSGAAASEGYGKAAYIRNLAHIEYYYGQSYEFTATSITIAATKSYQKLMLFCSGCRPHLLPYFQFSYLLWRRGLQQYLFDGWVGQLS